MIKRKNNEILRLRAQTEKTFKDEVMTEKKGVWKDTIGVYGCLTSCLANIIQIATNTKFTPRDMNDLIRENRGYLFLADKSTPEDKASIISWPVIMGLLPYVKFELFKKEPKFDTDIFVIGELEGRTHFVLVLCKKDCLDLKERFICFDVENNNSYIMEREQFDYFHILTLSGKGII